MELIRNPASLQYNFIAMHTLRKKRGGGGALYICHLTICHRASQKQSDQQSKNKKPATSNNKSITC